MGRHPPVHHDGHVRRVSHGKIGPRILVSLRRKRAGSLGRCAWEGAGGCGAGEQLIGQSASGKTGVCGLGAPPSRCSTTSARRCRWQSTGGCESQADSPTPHSATRAPCFDLPVRQANQKRRCMGGRNPGRTQSLRAAEPAPRMPPLLRPLLSLGGRAYMKSPPILSGHCIAPPPRVGVTRVWLTRHHF